VDSFIIRILGQFLVSLRQPPSIISELTSLTSSRVDLLVIVTGFPSRNGGPAQTTASHLLSPILYFLASSLSLRDLFFLLSSNLLRSDILVTKNQAGEHEVDNTIVYQRRKLVAVSLCHVR
jgi:hypothetical protein